MLLPSDTDQGKHLKYLWRLVIGRGDFRQINKLTFVGSTMTIKVHEGKIDQYHPLKLDSSKKIRGL
jgi:hypothetical protein